MFGPVLIFILILCGNMQNIHDTAFLCEISKKVRLCAESKEKCDYVRKLLKSAKPH